MRVPAPSSSGGARLALERFARRRRPAVERALAACLDGLGDCPPRLREAMAYSLLAGGKRLRPLLALASAEACGGSWRRAMPAACALEMVHTYSLVHDDLPAMDDDDLRRGRPTSHKVFGEALAILAGDALLTLAFGVLAGARGLDGRLRAALAGELAAAAGAGGMVGGQVADIESEGRRAGERRVRYIHRHKTAALIAASVRCGAMTAGAPPRALGRLDAYGMALGEAFQVVDDILDEEGDLAAMGKTPGSDRRLGKATLPAVAGMGAARRRAAKLAAEAEAALAPLGRRADVLRGAVAWVLERRS